MDDNRSLFAPSYVPDKEIKQEEDDEEDYPSTSIHDPHPIADEEAWLNFEDDLVSVRRRAAAAASAEDDVAPSGSTNAAAAIEEDDEEEVSSSMSAPTPLVKCLFCGAQVPGDRAYMDHINRFHATKPQKEDKKWRCEVCMKPTATKRELEIHMRSHAFTNRTLQQCTVCAKKVRTPTELRQHMRSHTGEKPFVCEFCGKNYSSNSEANKHRRQAHKVKPHGCSKCGERFDVVQQLRDHKKGCS